MAEACQIGRGEGRDRPVRHAPLSPPSSPPLFLLLDYFKRHRARDPNLPAPSAMHPEPEMLRLHQVVFLMHDDRGLSLQGPEEPFQGHRQVHYRAHAGPPPSGGSKSSSISGSSDPS